MYVHEKFGTPFLYFKTEDTNNFFSVHVRTPQEDDTGISHMLEHLSLQGSKKYPIRGVFFELNKRSYATFMNAFTASEYTAFPFSSTNKTDFMNNLDVYLDCVFHPMLGETEFLSECHHLKFENNDPTKELIHGGVIFNEMSGSYSDARTIFSQKTKEALYPDSATRFDIGGKPSEIPKATYESVKKHHHQYYHPVNAFFFFYGSFPVEEVFAKVSEVIDPMDVIESPYHPEKYEMKPWTEPRTTDIEAPADEKAPIEEQYQTQISWVIDEKCVDDPLMCDIENMVEILGRTNNSPLYKALVETKIAKSVVTIFDHEMAYPSIFIKACGFAKEKTQEVENIILDVVKKYSEEDLDFERLEGFAHKIRIANRMPSERQGLGLFSSCAQQWIHGANPLELVDFNRNLEGSYQRSKQPGYMSGLIKRFMVDNKHCLFSHFIPVLGYQERELERMKKELAEYKKTLTEEQIQKIVEDGKRVEEEQDKPKPVDLLPQIKRADLEKQCHYRYPDVEDEKATYFFNPTNGIAYITIIIDSPTDIPNLYLLPFMNSYLDALGAGRFDEHELTSYIQRWLHSAGIGISVMRSKRDFKLHAKARITGVCLYEDLDKLKDVLKMFIKEIHFDNYEKIGIITNQINSIFGRIINSNITRFNSLAAETTLSDDAALYEEISGLTGYLKAGEFFKKATPQEVGETLQTLFNSVLTNAEFMNAYVCCAKDKKEEITGFINEIFDTIKSIPKVEYEKFNYIKDAAEKYNNPNTFLKASIPTSYVTMLKYTVPYTDTKNSAMLAILHTLLSNEVIVGEIRAKHGAYSGDAFFIQVKGVFGLTTYRDSVPLTTSAALREIAKNAEKYINEEAIERAVVSYLSGIDSPENIATIGVKDAITCISYQNLQERRDIYLSLTVDEMKEACKFISDGDFTCSIATSTQICEPPEGFKVIEV